MAKIKSQPSGNDFKKIVHTEINLLEARLNKVFYRIDQKFYDLNEKLDNKVDLETFRNYRDEVLTGLDKVMGELKTIRDEQTIIGSEHGRIIDLEEKIEHLERMQFLHKKIL